MILDELMSIELIDFEVDVHTKKDVFDYIGSVLKEKEYIKDKAIFIADLYKREAMDSTNLIDHIAIPHSKSETIIKSSISLLRFKEEVDWEDGKDTVKVVFVIAVSPHEENITHLEAIASLATMLMEEDFVDILLKSNDKQEILNYIKQEIGG